jgi:1,4-alpha-glucan branching enzyme
MGGEFGQWKEWAATRSLDWHLLQYEPHQKLLNFVTDLNELYQEENALWEIDFEPLGFEWIDFHDAQNCVVSFVRKGKDPDEMIVCVFNFTPVKRDDYRVGVPQEGFYEEIFNTDSQLYWGTNEGNLGGLESEEVAVQNREHSISVTLPPLGGLYFKYQG